MFAIPCVAFLDAVHPFNIVVLFLVILIVVGPKGLPGVARKMGRMMETFRRAADEFKTQLMSMDQEPKQEPEQPSPYDTTPAVDADGVPQSSSDVSSGGAYVTPPEEPSPYENASPYPGNEEYAAGRNVTGPTAAQEDAPPPAAGQEEPAPETPASEDVRPPAEGAS
jgi:sec-independent protein translocase protein TatB